VAKAGAREGVNVKRIPIRHEGDSGSAQTCIPSVGVKKSIQNGREIMAQMTARRIAGSRLKLGGEKSI